MNHWIAQKPELLPDFMIGGAMKSGTSSIHIILNTHPNVFIPTSEIHFFDIDNILQHSDFNTFNKSKWISQNMEENPEKMWNWYYDKFKKQKAQIIGEDSTTYLASKIAAKRISIQKKEIKLIFILRQPSLRAYSNYFHLLRTGRAMYSFEETIQREPYQILGRSLYKEQIENYYQFIPKDRIKIILFEDFIQDQEKTINELCSFLNINFEEIPKEVLKTHSNKAKTPKKINLQIKRNRLMKDVLQSTYKNKLPFHTTDYNKTTPFLLKAFNKLHSKLNPNTTQKTPSINENTKLFLDNYFFNQLEGLDELINQDVLSKWFPDLV